MNENYLTVKEYSEKYKITKQAIYSKIKRGILKDKIVNDVKVILDDRIKPIDNNIAQTEKIEKSEIYNQYPKNNIEQQLNNNIESNSNAEKSEVKNEFLKETVERLLNEGLERAENNGKYIVENEYLKSTIEQLAKEKEILNRRLDTAENEKKELIERNREQNHLLMQSVKNTELLTNQVKELEYKVEVGQEKKGFWKRVFGEKKK